MSILDLSVIIPTYNKAHVLPATLSALECQTLDHSWFEVVVVDDGSTDGTADRLAELALSSSIRLAHQENAGAGAARNKGAALATGQVLLFLDADIILAPDAAAEHLAAHARYENALVVGRVLPLNPEGLEPEERLFQRTFDLGETEQAVPWHSTFTQSLSISRTTFFDLGAFNTDLIRGQDIDFAYRATQQGLVIRYTPTAIGRHNHSMGLEQRCAVERRNHQRLVDFYWSHPHLVSDVRYLRYKWPIDWRGLLFAYSGQGGA